VLRSACPLRAGTSGCWRPGAIPDRPFAFAADGLFDGHAYSRRGGGVDFSDPVWLRLGIINDLSLDVFPHAGDIARLARDRHSLAILHRWQLRLPYFVMVQMPAAFTGSELCWRGVLLWEGEREQFAPLTSVDTTCRTLALDDARRRIFGIAIEPDSRLAMTLKPNARILALRLINAATTLIAVGAILLVLVRWRPGGAALPVLLAALALIVIVGTDVTFVGGYRPFDNGDDGLIFSGFARRMLEALSHGDALGVLEGAEKVYGFTPGMRYFRALEYVLFGDSFLGYLTLMLALPYLVYRVAVRFLGQDWAIAFVLLFVLTPIGVVFGTTYAHFASWAARGYADPLGAMLFPLAGWLLMRRVALGRALLGTAVGTIVGGLVGYFLPFSNDSLNLVFGDTFSRVLDASVAGFLLAVLVLRQYVGRAHPSIDAPDRLDVEEPTG